jgi:hypothetical protein
MAVDAYQLFKTTYAQAIADGFAVAVATAVAQSVMDDTLRQQAVQPTVAISQTDVPNTRIMDKGPVRPSNR